MKKLNFILICCLVLLSAVNSWGAQGDFGFAAKAGTLGLGGEIRSGVFADLYVRAGYNTLLFDVDSSSSYVDYNMEAEFQNIAMLMDWHPFSGVFRVTFGLFVNNNEFAVTGTPRAENFPAEYAAFSPYAENIKVKGTVVFERLSPYLGFGWASNANEPGWGVAFDMGILFQGSPQMNNFDVVSTLYTQEELDGFKENYREYNQLLEDEVAYVEDDLSGFQYYPVASLTVTYNF